MTTPAKGAQLGSRLDQALASSVGGGPGQVPGVAVVVVDQDGPRYQGAFGERALGDGQPMRGDTPGRIASMTKPLVSAAALQLVAQGRLDLDAPGLDWCPDLGRVQVLDGFDPDGQPVLRPPARPVTLRHLLTHTAGFGYHVWNPDLARYHEVTGVPVAMSGRLASLQSPLTFDPGTRWQYGINTDWVGQLVEAGSGQRLSQYLADHVLEPLGMTDTSFQLTPDLADRAASSHARHPDDGTLHQWELPRPAHPEFDSGGGGLWSTMVDYGRFIQALLNNGVAPATGERVVDEATVALMATNAIGELRVSKLITQHPPISNDAELFEGDPKSWSLAFQVNQQPGHTGRPAGTLMWAGLTNCYCWIDRANGLGGAFMTQIFPFADPAALDLFYRVESITYAELS